MAYQTPPHSLTNSAHRFAASVLIVFSSLAVSCTDEIAQTETGVIDSIVGPHLEHRPSDEHVQIARGGCSGITSTADLLDCERTRLHLALADLAEADSISALFRSTAEKYSNLFIFWDMVTLGDKYRHPTPVINSIALDQESVERWRLQRDADCASLHFSEEEAVRAEVAVARCLEEATRERTASLFRSLPGEIPSGPEAVDDFVGWHLEYTPSAEDIQMARNDCAGARAMVVMRDCDSAKLYLTLVDYEEAVALRDRHYLENKGGLSREDARRRLAFEQEFEARWRASRDIDCAYVELYLAGGSGAESAVAQCLAESTRERTEEILQALPGATTAAAVPTM